MISLYAGISIICDRLSLRGYVFLFEKAYDGSSMLGITKHFLSLHQKLASCLGLFVVGFIIAAYYIFSTNCFTVYDAARDYWLFNYYRLNPIWVPMVGSNALQNTAIFTGYLPGVLQWITHISPDMLFKIYSSLGVAVVPVIAYLISRKVVSNLYSIFSAIYLIGWVAFYQGGSYLRLNFAVAMVGLIILTQLSNLSLVRKTIVGCLLALLLPFAHYGTSFISLLVFGGVSCMMLLRKDRAKTITYALITLAISVSFIAWQIALNPAAWVDIREVIHNSSTNTVSTLSTKDKITQVAFGANNTQLANNGLYSINYFLLFWAWLTVGTLLIGLRDLIRGKYLAEIKVIVVILLLSIVTTVVISPISQEYGLEKVFYMASIILGVPLVLGCRRIADWLHTDSWVTLSVIVLPYVILMWSFGRIISIEG